MNLPFFAADTLGCTLYAVKGGLVANEVHQMPFGPWRVDLAIDVTSDLMSGTEIGLWVTLGKRLQTYLIVREKESWMLVLDDTLLKECGARTGFGSTTVAERVVEIKPAVKGIFRWAGDSWSRVQYDGSTMGG